MPFDFILCQFGFQANNSWDETKVKWFCVNCWGGTK